MSNRFEIENPTLQGESLVAVFFNADGEYFNTDTGEAEEYDPDNWADYAVALTAEGAPGRFVCEVPAGLEADRLWRASIRAGTGPLDTKVGGYEFWWDGVAIIDRVGQIMARTDMIQPQGLTIAPVYDAQGRVLRLARGSAYSAAVGNPVEVSTGYTMPNDISGWAVRLVIQKRPGVQNEAAGTPVYHAGTIHAAVGPTKTFRFDLDSADTQALPVSVRTHEFTVELLKDGGATPTSEQWAAGPVVKPVIGDVIVMRAGSTDA